ncbi:cell envelope integrity protein TolA [Luteimonas sp. A649]
MAQPWPRQIMMAIEGNWIRPPIEETGSTGCTASIELAETGDVMSIHVKSPCAPERLRASIEAAIIKSSPLPLPRDPAVFRSRIILHFTPRDEGGGELTREVQHPEFEQRRCQG